LGGMKEGGKKTQVGIQNNIARLLEYGILRPCH
jgi:hypothetical protein